MKIRRFAIVALVAVGACGGAAELEPGPGARLAPPGPGRGAIASDAGVQVEVRTDAWGGVPSNLEDYVTPLYVEITNNSNREMLVTLDGVRLEQGENTFRAVPPRAVGGQITEAHAIYDYPSDRFRVMPYGRPYWPRPNSADPFWYDDSFYDRMTTTYRTFGLPTRDMIESALPEGILEPGGTVRGFVYFEDIDDDDWDVTFSTYLLDPKTENAFGRVDIPMMAH